MSLIKIEPIVTEVSIFSAISLPFKNIFATPYSVLLFIRPENSVNHFERMGQRSNKVLEISFLTLNGILYLLCAGGGGDGGRMLY